MQQCVVAEGKKILKGKVILMQDFFIKIAPVLYLIATAHTWDLETTCFLTSPQQLSICDLIT